MTEETARIIQLLTQAHQSLYFGTRPEDTALRQRIDPVGDRILAEIKALTVGVDKK